MRDRERERRGGERKTARKGDIKKVTVRKIAIERK